VDNGTATAIGSISFFAHATGRYGVNAACGDVEGDGYAEIVTGRGPDPSHPASLRGWNWDGTAVTEITALARDPFPGLSYGLTVGSGALGY
jgi:hypothetical protein